MFLSFRRRGEMVYFGTRRGRSALVQRILKQVAHSILMAKLYEKMLAQGERPAAALRAAQVEMWKQKHGRHLNWSPP